MTMQRLQMARRRWLHWVGAGLVAGTWAQREAWAVCAQPWAAPAFTLPVLNEAAETMARHASCADRAAHVSAHVCSEQLRGRWLYLDFWASWCAPCRQSIPWMNQLQSRFSQTGLQVVGVSVDRQKNNAERFLNKLEAGFPMLWDPAGHCAQSYQVQAMPSSYVINPQGQVMSVHRGFNDVTAQALITQIGQLMQGACSDRASQPGKTS
jgi:cytochrome c biogenesis protein CcmG, thiol:disulfide interchange protein DsbE